MIRYSTLFAAAFVCVSLIVAPGRAFAESHIPDEPGPCKVGHTYVIAVDSARGDRQLPLNIWYPVDDADHVGDFTLYRLLGPLGITSTVAIDDVPASAGGQRNLIVFSHGFGGIGLQSIRLMEHLASHCFVVVSPDHTGNTSFDNSSPNPEADRYPDIAFVIDYMEERNNEPGGAFEGRVDTSNVGVAGHSYGGMTSILMAAGYDPWAADVRVRAILPIASSSIPLTDEQIQSITIPTCFLVGTSDGLEPVTTRAYDLLSSGDDRYRANLIGGNHTHFSNVCDIGNVLINAGLGIDQWAAVGAEALIAPYNNTCSPEAYPIDEAVRLQNLYAASCFRRHLRGERFYENYLTPQYATARETDIEFFGAKYPVVDSFMCYKAKNTAGTLKPASTSSALVDDFESGQFSTKKTKALCAPAERDLVEVVDRFTYLTSYQIKAEESYAGPESLQVTDVFGSWDIAPIKADSLRLRAEAKQGGVPGAPADARDDYKCYKAKTAKGSAKLPKGVVASVADDFEDRNYGVKKLLRLCLPVNRDGVLVVGADNLLTCYKAKRSKGEAAHTQQVGVLRALDANALQALDTVTEDELCVPASTP